jgi:thiosulfate dehydrogenase
MPFNRSNWFPVCLFGISLLAVCMQLKTSRPHATQASFYGAYDERIEWVAPPEQEMPPGREGDLVRYGKELVVNTSYYLGPEGIVARLTNGMNCQNCHLQAGTQNLGNPFSAVSSNYPLFRHRSGRMESVEYRIKECMERSLNGKSMDSSSLEMQAMTAYVKWVGKDVPKSIKPTGAGVMKLPWLSRAADPAKGKALFILHCQRCHGANGEGEWKADSTGFAYPPLWGENSFNTGAGLLRISSLAGFIRNNMPFGTTSKTPVLSIEEAWDVAAFICTQPRPVKVFPSDWKDISKKPVDFPFGPYADSFPESQHKLGPFENMGK